MEQKYQCNDCLTIFTGLLDFKFCPECEGEMHEVIKKDILKAGAKHFADNFTNVINKMSKE